MCSFTVLRGVQKPVSDSVSGVTIICLMQCNTSPSHRVDVDCGLWNVGPLLFNGSCWILAGTGMRCRIRRSRASKTCSTGDMSSSLPNNWGCFWFHLRVLSTLFFMSVRTLNVPIGCGSGAGRVRVGCGYLNLTRKYRCGRLAGR